MKPHLPAAMLAAMLGALLSGCAAPDAPPGGAPEAVAQTTLPPPVTGPVNGIYQGSSRQIEAKLPACPYAGKGLIEIGDRTLLFPYTYQLIYVAPVQPDGTLHAVNGDTVLDGKLVSGDLSFSVTTPVCQSSFSLRRQSGF